MTLYKLNTDVIGIEMRDLTPKAGVQYIKLDLGMLAEALYDLGIIIPVEEKKCCNACYRCASTADQPYCRDIDCTCHTEEPLGEAGGRLGDLKFFKEDSVMTPKTNEEMKENVQKIIRGEHMVATGEYGKSLKTNEWEEEWIKSEIETYVDQNVEERVFNREWLKFHMNILFPKLLTRATAEAEKAFGGCKNCYGKGYSTVRETAGSYRTGVWLLDSYIPCPKCDRGKQIQEMKEYMRAEAAEDERQFILNVLDGIDEADRQMQNKGGGTKAIRFALQNRIISRPSQEREA